MQLLREKAAALLAGVPGTADLLENSTTSALVALGVAQVDFTSGAQLFREILTGSLTGPGLPLGQISTLGFILAGLYECAPEGPEADNLLEECYPLIISLLRHCYTDYDPEEEGLLTINHLCSSFFPNASVWDELQPGKEAISVQDPLLNAVAVWSNECLVDIGTHLGQDVLELLQWNELTIYSVNEKLWDEQSGIYRPFDLQRQCHLATDSILGLMPMVGEIPDQDRAEELLQLLRSECLPMGTEQSNSHINLGCRSNSILAHWFLSHGLERYGMFAAAEKLKMEALQLMQQIGFLEAYHSQQEGGEPALDIRHLTAAALCIHWLAGEH